MAQFRPSRLAASSVAVLISGLVLVQTAAAQGLNTGGSGSGSTPSPMFGELYGSSAQCAIQRSVSQFQMLARLIGHIDGGEGATVYELSQSAPGTSQTNGYGDTTWDVSQDGGQTLIRGQNPAGAGCAWETWANGYDLGANVDRSTVAHDLDYTVSGAQFGAHRTLDCGAVLGAFGGCSLQCIDVSAADRTADINSGQLGAFLRHGEAGDYWLLGGAVAYDSYDTQRQSPTNPANIARGEFDGAEAIAYLERRWTVWERAVALEPTAALQYTWLHQEGFRETGAGWEDLSFAAANTLSLRSVLGASLTTGRRTNFGLLTPELHAQWMHEYLDATTSTFVAFSAGGPVVVSTGVGPGRDWFVLGAGFAIDFCRHASLFANYDLQLNNRTSLHMVNCGLQW